jgi:hypothetical protein
MTYQKQNRLDQSFEQITEIMIAVVVVMSSFMGTLSLYALPILGV